MFVLRGTLDSSARRFRSCSVIVAIYFLFVCSSIIFSFCSGIVESTDGNLFAQPNTSRDGASPSGASVSLRAFIANPSESFFLILGCSSRILFHIRRKGK